jgi:Family of unknown function (DUF5977)
MMKRLMLFGAFAMVASKLFAQVNLQTGSATFSLPMFSWQDDKSRLGAIVALSYNSGNGLRVNETASNAGQGWNLVTGGEIIRMQVGEPDDQVARPGNGDFDVSKYPPGILYATVPATNGCPVPLAQYPIYGHKNQVYTQHNVIGEDKQLDYFSFQFNGKAGMFVLDPYDVGDVKFIGDSKMLISYQTDNNLTSQGIRTNITSFRIQDVDGLIYKFTQHGLTKVLKTSYCDENFNYIQTQPKFKNGEVYYQGPFEDGTIINPWIIGSWYLTEIEDALTHRKVFYNYVTRNVNAIAGHDISFNETNRNYGIVSRKKSITQTPEISTVTCPDGHTVTVNYGNERKDVPGEYAVASVDINYQGRYLSKYELNTSYFILNRYGTPVSDYEKKVARLCLKSVKKIGVDLKEDTPPYRFDYYTGSSNPDDFVPPPYSYAKDIFGFYNGSNTTGFNNEGIPLTANINTIKNTNQIKGLCYMKYGVAGVNLNAKPGYAKNGLLRQIVYPTGGTLTYTYDQNTGLLAGNTINSGGVHVTQTSSTDGGFSNGCANPVTTSYNYVTNGVGSSSSLWGLEVPNNTIVSHNHYQPEYKYYKWKPECFPFGCCYWKFQYPGILSQQQAMSLTDLQKAIQTVSPVLNILSILSTIKDLATAIGGGSPVSLIIDVIVGLVQTAISCIGTQERNSTGTIHINSDLNAAAPLPAQFKRVEVVEGTGTIGKTVQEFTSDADYAIWEATNSIYAAKQRFAPWAYGLPKKTTVYDVNGNKVTETENIYNFNTRYSTHCASETNPIFNRAFLTKQPLPNFYSTKCQVERSSSLRSTTWGDPAYYNSLSNYQTSTTTDMSVETYNMYTGRSELDTTYERVFKPNNSTDFAETKTVYHYNNDNYEPNVIQKFESDGTVTRKEIYYTIDYINRYNNCHQLVSGASTTNSEIVTLVQKNIISLPVETATRRFVWPAGGEVLSDKATIFTTLANGDIKPLKILDARFAQPGSSIGNGAYTINGSFAYHVTPPSLDPANPDYNFYKTAQTFSYDAAGNLAGVKDEGGRTITNIYDYDDKYVVASVINAYPLISTTAYSSFETTNFGGWVLNGSANYTTANMITGNRSFDMTPGTSLTGFFFQGGTIVGPYTLSFWSNNSNITVSSNNTTVVLVKSSPTINGMTYYEYKIGQPTVMTDPVIVSGNGIIDELRLYPLSARMRSTTYDPLIGKTSECDENNQITYYEYDALGRLKFVKDEKGNVVKMNEYNNISEAKQNGCPGTYYNRFITQVYTKNDCPPGYQGTEVIYNVPANTYSSALSQDDADAKAEYQLISMGQAFANTNGSCQQIFYSAAMSVTDTTESCDIGYVGGLVTYTVPFGRYTSIISQADADEKAQDDLDANADNYINSAPNAVCIFSTAPQWEWPENGATMCQGGHLFVLETDVNPNSPSYLQTRWSDVGPDSNCPPPNCNPSTCAAQGEAYACINDVCEMGIRVNTSSTYIPASGLWECVYHYEYSDLSWSGNYIEYNTEQCAL